MALRIKDSVDLKELEKYGFKNGFQEYYILDNNGCTHLSIKKSSKNIKTRTTDYKCKQVDEILDIIYDLIKSDLVVKVEE